MIEIRLEIDPKNRTPLECINLLVEKLENLVKNQDIECYLVSFPSRGERVLEGELVNTFQAIHAGGKDVTP